MKLGQELVWLYKHPSVIALRGVMITDSLTDSLTIAGSINLLNGGSITSITMETPHAFMHQPDTAWPVITKIFFKNTQREDTP